MKKHIYNLLYAAGSNFIAMAVSIALTFIVPKILGVKDFSLFQLYLFYNSYAAFAYFGWADGILLRHGGEIYNELNYKMYKTQWILYIAFISCIALIVLAYTLLHFSPQESKRLILIFVCANILIDLPKTYLRYVLQSTNLIKEYAQPLILEKATNLVTLSFLVFTKNDSFISYIVLDLIGKVVSLLLSIYHCRKIAFSHMGFFKEAMVESKKNLYSGSQLMIANVSSMLIVGVVRFFIEQQWDLVTFGEISLTISISNLLMIFIRAVALVIFPMLRRTSKDKLSGIYSTMRTCLMVPLLGMLVFYYPLKSILTVWLPQYAESLKYMAILFPMCVFESKMSMLVETYMKTLRKEKWLLRVNVTTVLFSFVLTLTTAYWLHNLDLAIMSIVFLLAFRCVFAELMLSTVLQVKVKKDILLEIGLTLLFICASWLVGGFTGLLIYVIAYVGYLMIKRKEIALVAYTAKRYVKKT